MITVIVLLQVEKNEVNNIAKKLAAIDGVQAVYSVAGRYDLVTLVQAKDHESIASLVTDNILLVDGITKSETLISFRVYSKQEIDGMFSIGLENNT